MWLSFGDPAPHIAVLHGAGAMAICQVQSVDEAVEAVAAGADVIVAQGTESGGHGSDNESPWTLLPRSPMPWTRHPFLPPAASAMPMTCGEHNEPVPPGRRWAPASTPATKRWTRRPPNSGSSSAPVRHDPHHRLRPRSGDPSGRPVTAGVPSRMPPSNGGTGVRPISALESRANETDTSGPPRSTTSTCEWSGPGSGLDGIDHIASPGHRPRHRRRLRSCAPGRRFDGPDPASLRDPHGTRRPPEQGRSSPDHGPDLPHGFSRPLPASVRGTAGPRRAVALRRRDR